MNLLPANILGFIESYGYLTAFVTMLLSGPFGAIGSGFLAGNGIFNPFYIWMLSLAADMVSDIFYYELGRRGGRRILAKIERFFKWTHDLEAKVEWLFQTHGKKTIFLIKFTQGFGALTQIMAGIGKMKRSDFILLNALSGAIKSAIYVSLGVAAGAAWEAWAQRLEHAGLIITALVLVFLTIVVISGRAQKKLLDKAPDHNPKPPHVE